MAEKYVLEVDIDHETGEEHCTVLKTDGTTNMANWIEIVSAMYTHHSILEPLIDELNKIQNNYNNTEKYAIKLWEENEQLKQFKEQHIEEYLKLKTVSNELKKENEQLKKELESFRPIIFESDGKPVTLYKKGGDVE